MRIRFEGFKRFKFLVKYNYTLARKHKPQFKYLLSVCMGIFSFFAFYKVKMIQITCNSLYHEPGQVKISKTKVKWKVQLEMGIVFVKKQNKRRQTTRIIQRNEKLLLKKQMKKTIVFVERTNFPKRFWKTIVYHKTNVFSKIL